MQRSRRFFAWVLLTVLAVMLPLLTLHIHTLYTQHQAAEAAVHQQVRARSAETAARLNQVFARAETLLRLLASRADIQSLDPKRCAALIEGMAMLDPLYANVAASDMTGLVICASVPPERRKPLRFSGPRWQAAVAADALHLSTPMNVGPILGQPIAVLTLPMRDASGRQIGMVGLSFDLVGMAERVFAPGLPPGGSVTLVNEDSTIVTRHPEPAKWVGTPTPRSVRDARRDNPSGVILATGPDGVSRVYATTPLGVHGLRLASGIPTDVVLAEARAANQRSLSVAGLTLLAALVVALYAARWLSSPLQSLVGTARHWAEGRNDQRADEHLPGEFRPLAQEFNRMIDARLASEAQLRESERRYAEMLDGVDMLAITVDPEGRLTYCNDALLRLTGWRRDEVIGQSWARHFLPADSPQLRDYLQGLEPGAPRQARSEGHIVTRQGEQRLVRWAHAALRGPEGEPMGSSSIGEDITERRELELARQASAEAAAANEAKTDFLARMSHELRTPLNAVLGFSQLLQISAQERLHEAERHQLGMIFVAGEQLRALIEDILDVSRIEAGRLAVEHSAVDVGALLNEVLRLTEHDAAQAGVQLVGLPPEHPPLTLHTDPVRLRQVLLNLVSNGIKYNRPGGQVSVAMATVGAEVCISVSDNGLGMTAEQQQSLFEPFNRLGREHTPISGTGIGMMLSRQLVRLMGGEVSVTSAVDAGTTVRVALPLRAGPLIVATPPGTPVAAATEASPQGRVLYIEDNEANAVLVQQLLARWPGVELSLAVDGASGLAQAEALLPDLVLLDMQLPDMDGLRVLERLRGRPATRRLRVVVLSASAMPADVEKARRAGALDYWTKPIEFEPFLQGLSALLASTGPR